MSPVSPETPSQASPTFPTQSANSPGIARRSIHTPISASFSPIPNGTVAPPGPGSLASPSTFPPARAFHRLSTPVIRPESRGDANARRVVSNPAPPPTLVHASTAPVEFSTEGFAANWTLPTLNQLDTTVQNRPSSSAHRPPSQANYRPPSQANYRPPSQANYRPPSQSNFRSPSQTNFRPPSQPNFRSPSQTNLNSPSQTNLNSPSQPNLRSQSQANIRSPSQTSFHPPSQTNFRPASQANVRSQTQADFRSQSQANFRRISSEDPMRSMAQTPSGRHSSASTAPPGMQARRQRRKLQRRPPGGSRPFTPSSQQQRSQSAMGASSLHMRYSTDVAVPFVPGASVEQLPSPGSARRQWWRVGSPSPASATTPSSPMYFPPSQHQSMNQMTPVTPVTPMTPMTPITSNGMGVAVSRDYVEVRSPEAPPKKQKKERGVRCIIM